MAVTSIWDIKGHADGVIKYAVNPEKTTASNAEAVAKLHAIDNVIMYAADEIKTEKCLYVTGINCEPDTAIQNFKDTKKHWDKLGGIVAFHGIQSFAPGETDAATAHDIGVNLAKELWGDRFEVIVSTHCNTDCFHNHFVLNSVSIKDGNKYNDCNETYYRMREVSDRLCEEYGLSVIKEPKGKGQSYAEKMAERNGEYTVRGSIREAIDVAIKGSVNMEQFKDAMDQMGYIIDMHGKYPKIKHIGAPRFMRFRSLGEGYDYEDICSRIIENDYPEYPEIPEQESPQAVFEGENTSVKDMNYIATYRCFIRAIEITMTRPEANRHMYFLMQNEHRKLESYQVQFRIAAENRLETDVDLLNFRVKVMEKQAMLADTRKDLRNALKRAERGGDLKAVTEIKFKIESVTRQIKSCRDELRAVDEIAERSGIMKEKLQLIAEEKFRGKEVMRDKSREEKTRTD